MSFVLVNKAVLQLVVNCLERDASEGKTIRKEILEELLKNTKEREEPVAWAYRAFPDSELITLTMDKDDLDNATDGSIALYE